MSSSFLTTRGKRAPVLPELANISSREWADMHLAGTEVGFQMLGNKADAFDAVHDAYLALTSTHRFDPAKHKTVVRHFLALVKIASLKIMRTGEREDDALERAYEPDSVAEAEAAQSPEAIMIAREEAEAHEGKLLRVRDRLRRLQRCVAYDRAAVALIEYWAEHGADRPIPQIAAALGLPVDEVHAAKKLIERKARAIMVNDTEGDDE